METENAGATGTDNGAAGGEGETRRRRRNAAPAQEQEAVSEQVTYLPREGDPATVKHRGITFHANVPKTLTNAEQIEQLRGNKFFKVGEFDPATDRVRTEHETRPKTPEQYRAHCIAWLNRVHSVDELDTKWAQEETLRMECGVGTDDLDYLGHLIAPKRAELRKQEQVG